MTYNENLNFLMKKYDIRNTTLAKMTGFSESYISKIRNGVNVPAKNSIAREQLFKAMLKLLPQANKDELLVLKSLEKNVLRETKKKTQTCENLSRLLVRIMDLFNLKNADLAKILNCSPSLISKYRTGHRVPSIENEIVLNMASYFEKLAKEKNLERELLERLDICTKESANLDLKNAILESIKGDGTDISLMDNIFNMMEDYHPININYSKITKIIESANILNAEIIKKTGKEGLRKHVLLFLSLCAKSEEKLEIKLFSDQNMEWMTEDKEFFEIWRLLMLAILNSGHKIKIVHNTSRTKEELFSALEGWTPLHLTGNIESYYYTLPASELFSNTIFLNCDNFAIMGNAVVGLEDETDYYFTLEKSTLKKLEIAYDLLTKNGKKLLHTNSIRSEKDLKKLSDELIREYKYNSIYLMQQNPPLWTIDEELLSDIIKINDCDKNKCEHILSYSKLLKDYYKEALKYKEIYEIFYIPKEFPYEGILLDSLDIIGNERLKYTKMQFKKNLKQIANKLKTHKNYHIAILDRPMFQDIKMMHFEKGSFYAIRSKPPISVINYQNQSIVEKGLLYMKNRARSSLNSIDSFDEVIELLEDWEGDES
ncbi:MAG: helix-turn-helix transcriptional regulator [Tissierellia bacterium]|nr:helix-turn-helix transcriptional regulator [Tissierellia bacterium]